MNKKLKMHNNSLTSTFKPPLCNSPFLVKLHQYSTNQTDTPHSVPRNTQHVAGTRKKVKGLEQFDHYSRYSVL